MMDEKFLVLRMRRSTPLEGQLSEIYVIPSGVLGSFVRKDVTDENRAHADQLFASANGRVSIDAVMVESVFRFSEGDEEEEQDEEEEEEKDAPAPPPPPPEE